MSVSVIILSYNNGDTIQRAVESAISQSYPVEEIIVTDDCSSDGSQSVLEQLAVQDRRINLILRDRNVGEGANRDHAYRIAKGNYITALDGDDYFLPEKVEGELRAIDGATDSVAYSSYILAGAMKTSPVPVGAEFGNKSRKELISALVLRKEIIPKSLLMPKTLFLKAGGMRHDMPMYVDWELELRVVRVAREWRYSGVTGYYYERRLEGLSAADARHHVRWKLQALLHNHDWLCEELGEVAAVHGLLQPVVASLGGKGVTIHTD